MTDAVVQLLLEAMVFDRELEHSLGRTEFVIHRQESLE